MVHEHALTASLDPTAPLEDLEPIRELIGDARVVGIGESAHHAPEFYVDHHAAEVVLRLLEHGAPDTRIVLALHPAPPMGLLGADGFGLPVLVRGGSLLAQGRRARPRSRRWAMVQHRSNPFRGFVDMFTEMERMRRLGRTGTVGRREDQPRTHDTAWVPSADIFADGRNLVIHLELPGVQPADIDVTFSWGVLTISGERRSDLPDSTTFYARERYYGPFERSMILPEGIDETMIRASFEDGVAEITVENGARTTQESRIPIEDRSSRQAAQVRTRRK